MNERQEPEAKEKAGPCGTGNGNGENEHPNPTTITAQCNGFDAIDRLRDQWCAVDPASQPDADYLRKLVGRYGESLVEKTINDAQRTPWPLSDRDRVERQCFLYEQCAIWQAECAA